MAQAKAVFLLPLADTDGTDLSAGIRQVEDAVFAAFGGWRTTGVVHGTYSMSDGRKVTDGCRQYAVLLDGDRLPELRDILKRFKAGTRQESIYLEVTPDVRVENV